MNTERRAPGPGRGILSLGLSVLCWLMFLLDQTPPDTEMPLGMLAIVPVAVIMHIVALVTLGFGPKWNRWLAAAALVLFWGGYGLMLLGPRMGWF